MRAADMVRDDSLVFSVNHAAANPADPRPSRGLDAARAVNGERRTASKEEPERTGTKPRVLRIDAHCHSSASSAPVVPLLKHINAPESYSDPERVYEQAMARGMDLVTLTDHDSIDGAMRLIEKRYDNVVVGEEVTVFFPEDRCKLHVLVWLLTPTLHDEIDSLRLRDDVYAFARWLRDRSLPHALAHPLYIQNGRLTGWHLDRCALLFKGFELINGAHSGTHVSGLTHYLKALTPGRINRLIKEHNIEPVWPRSWEKATTGGSDDHGLLNVGRAWTAVSIEDVLPPLFLRTREEREGRIDGETFFRAVMAGRGSPGGTPGHSSLLAHQLTTVAGHYFARNLATKASPAGQVVAGKLLRFAGAESPRPAKARLWWQVLKGKALAKFGLKRRPLKPVLDALKASFGPVIESYPDLRERLDPSAWADGAAISQHERMAEFADDLYAAMHAFLADGAIRSLKDRDRRGIVDHFVSHAVLELSQLPYIFSLFHQNKERRFVETIEHEHAEPGSGVSVLERPMRVLLFTDTLGDVNGVSRFIRNAADHALASGHDLRVITSTRFDVPSQANIANYRPLFACAMPKYEHLELTLPPLVRMLRDADAHRPDVIHVSTPGPVGFVGLLASRVLRVPVVGVYHTDFPAYIDHLFDDEALTWATARAMRWFYAPFRSVFTRSEEYVRSLEMLGLPRERVLSLLPGIRTEEFHPRHADRSCWSSYGGDPGAVHVLSVGRVSIEKNLPLLTRVWRRADAMLKDRGVKAELVVVGDGPYRAKMQEELAGTRVRFLGFRYGEELGRLYASSDLFVFPSVTDTLGQVVMEAQAAGIPVIVSDKGGPKEVVIRGETGFVIDDQDGAGWAERIVSLAGDEATRRAMGAKAHASMQAYTMAKSFEHFWGVHEAAWAESLAGRGLRARGSIQRVRLAKAADRPHGAEDRSVARDGFSSRAHPRVRTRG